MKKADMLELRLKLYDIEADLGNALTNKPDSALLKGAYDSIYQALNDLETYCIELNYLDSETLEVL